MTSETDDLGDDSSEPTLRQRLHSATGDRDAEAKALADRADTDIDEDDAEVAVKRAHGEMQGGEPGKRTDLATPEDATVVRKDRSS